MDDYTSMQERVRRLQQLFELNVNASRVGLPSAPMDFLPPWFNDSEYVVESRVAGTRIASITLLVLVVLVVALRFWSRLMALHALRWDDYFMVPASLFTISLAALEVKWTDFGLGRHVWDVTIADVNTAYMLLYVHLLLHPAAVHMTKLSLLWFLRTLTIPNSKMRAVTTFYCGFQVAFLISTLCTFAFQCTPIQAGWSLPERFLTTSKCLGMAPLYYSFATIHVVSDFILLLMPIPIVWSLELKTRKRLIVCGLFGLGVMAFIAAAVRLSFIGKMLDGFDLNWNLVDPLIWGVIEASIAIICASLPALKPLIERCFPRVPKSRGASNDSSFGASKPYISRHPSRRVSQEETQVDDFEMLRLPAPPSPIFTGVAPLPVLLGRKSAIQGYKITSEEGPLTLNP